MHSKFFNSLLLFIIIFLVSCGQKQKPVNDVNLKSIDSLWLKIQEAKENENEGFKKVIVLYWSALSKKPKEIEYLFKLIESESKLTKDADWLNSLYLFKSWNASSRMRVEEAEQYLNKMNTQNIELSLSQIQQFGFLYYSKNELDTVLHFYKKGYQIAKNANQKNWLLNYSNNLGTVYYDLRELDLASKYFKEALNYAQEIKVKVPMLYNNIITCALGMNGNEDAYDLYEKFKSEFKSTLPYEIAIYDLNHVNILINKNQFKEAEIVLKKIDTSTLDENLRIMYDLQLVNLAYLQNDVALFEKLFFKYKSQIFENPETLLPKWTTILIETHKLGLKTYEIGELIKLYNQKNVQNRIRLKNNVAEILEEFSNNPVEKSKWKIIALSTKIEIDNIHDGNFQNDMFLNFKLSVLTLENDKIRYQVELKEIENKQYVWAFVCSVLVVLLIVILLMFYLKNRKIEIEKLRLEILNSRTLNENNKNKRIFADRLISSNQAMAKKLTLIIKNIQKSQYAKDPEIIQIKRELTLLTEIEEGLYQEMDQLKATDVLMFLSDKYQCLNDMNHTEKTILGYLLNGQKIKDIAGLMSISEQHARNTKTRVLKMMSQESNTTVTIEDLLLLKSF